MRGRCVNAVAITTVRASQHRLGRVDDEEAPLARGCVGDLPFEGSVLRSVVAAEGRTFESPATLLAELPNIPLDRGGTSSLRARSRTGTPSMTARTSIERQRAYATKFVGSPYRYPVMDSPGMLLRIQFWYAIHWHEAIRVVV